MDNLAQVFLFNLFCNVWHDQISEKWSSATTFKWRSSLRMFNTWIYCNNADHRIFHGIKGHLVDTWFWIPDTGVLKKILDGVTLLSANSERGKKREKVNIFIIFDFCIMYWPNQIPKFFRFLCSLSTGVFWTPMGDLDDIFTDTTNFYGNQPKIIIVFF